jgi:hypothetical protein
MSGENRQNVFVLVQAKNQFACRRRTEMAQQDVDALVAEIHELRLKNTQLEQEKAEGQQRLEQERVDSQ